MVKGFLLGLKVVAEKLHAEVDPSEGSREQAELQNYFGNYYCGSEGQDLCKKLILWACGSKGVRVSTMAGGHSRHGSGSRN